MVIKTHDTNYVVKVSFAKVTVMNLNDNVNMLYSQSILSSHSPFLTLIMTCLWRDEDASQAVCLVFQGLTC